MNAYFRSASGRFLLAGVGVFLLGEGLACLLSPSGPGLVATSLAPLLAIVLGTASVGTGIQRYPLQALLVTILGPVVLWPASMLASLLQATAPSWGHALVSLGVLAFVGVVLTMSRSPRATEAVTPVHAR
jgi:hypothetical protein